MKLFLIIFFAVFSSSIVVHAQQSKFLNVARYKMNGDFIEFYIDPANGIDDFEQMQKNEDHLIISIPLDPASSEEVKDSYIKLVIKEIEELTSIYNNFKTVELWVGEQIFLKTSEVVNIYENKKKYKQLAKINMKRAWGQLGTFLLLKFPKAKIYGINYSW